MIATIESIFNLMYPVGSIYCSTSNTNPSTLFGGTWEQITGKFLYAADSSHAAGTTGGAATHKLTVSEMPSHTHTFTGSAANTGNGAPGHTHTYAKAPANTGGPSVNYTGGHKITVSQLPSHSHSMPFTHRNQPQIGSAEYWGYILGSSGSEYQTGKTGGGTAHTHTLSSHTHSITTSNVASGGWSANHTHSVTAKGTLNSVGSGTSFSIMPPYLSVYMWKRTA